MRDAAELTLRSFPLTAPAGADLRLWLPSDPDDRVRQAQASTGDTASTAADLLGFWATLWPAAITSAHLVGTTNLIDASTNILEVGCGCGLVGLAAAMRGASVTMTDGDPAGVELTRRNIEENGLADRCSAAVFRWEDPPDPAWQPDLLLGCDVLYEPSSHALLARLISGLGCTALLTDPQRPSAAGAADALRAAGLSVWDSTAPAIDTGCALRVLVAQPS